MASSSITAYVGPSGTQSFELANTSLSKTQWMAPGRALSTPFTISMERKLSQNNSPSNDHVILRVTRVEQNATTGKLATFQATLDVSIPKDQSVLVPAEQVKMLSILSSVLNEGTAMEATNANITRVIEGRDL